MSDTNLMLDVGQANELKLTYRREGWSNADIKAFCEKKGFGRDVLDVLHGRAEINQRITLPSPTSTGMFGDNWMKYFKSQGFNPPDFILSYLKDVMLSSEFNKSVTKGTTYRPVLLKGEDFKKVRTIQRIRREARRRRYTTPPPELAPLLRKVVSDREIETLGISRLIIMHDPIEAVKGNPRLLYLNCSPKKGSRDSNWFGVEVLEWDKYGNSPSLDNIFKEDELYFYTTGFVFLEPETT